MPSSHCLPPTQRLDGFHFLHRLVSPFTSSQSWSAAALLCAALLLSQSTPTLAAASGKRGLIDITTLPNSVQDNAVIIGNGSDISWYYNYGPSQTPALAGNKNLEFVPMLWSDANSGKFFSTVESQIKAGANIKAVLGFNEPDNCYGNTGGSCMQPAVAAQVWKSQIEPLKQKYGLQLGMPGITSSQMGLNWLAQWYAACAGGCNPDFLTIHVYSNFDGVASWIGQMNATFLGNITGGTWVTEFAYERQPLNATQAYYNMTLEYFDRLDYIKRYSYFGSFRSDVSNVGPNVAMMNSQGKLTDIGSWYVGGNATGVLPDVMSATSGSSSGSSTPAKGAASSGAQVSFQCLTAAAAAVMGWLYL